jgi:hypothetical protein
LGSEAKGEKDFPLTETLNAVNEFAFNLSGGKILSTARLNFSRN